MATDDDSTGDPLVLPGRALSLAWLAVSLAPSNDKDRPALYRRIVLEVHDYGVVFAATDSYWLARAFVPFDGETDAWTPPTFDEVVRGPRFVVADVEHRVRDLMAYVERRTRGCDDENSDAEDCTIVIARGRDYDPDVPTLDPTLSAPQVIVEIPGEERIIVRESEIDYPNLSKLARFQPKIARRLLFSPTLLGRVASAAQRMRAPALKITATSAGSVAWEALDGPGHLHGILMPLRDEEEDPLP